VMVGDGSVGAGADGDGGAASSGGAGARMGAKWRAHALSTQAIFTWYLFNGATVILNRFVFLPDFGFRFPLALTFMHLISGFVLSALFIQLVLSDTRMLPLRASTYTRERLVFALLFAGNIILGNVALKFIPVSFMQTVKASTPFFVTLFSWSLFRVRFTVHTQLTLAPVVLGVVLASAGELSFDIRGFVAVTAACFVQALQIVYASRLLNESERDASRESKPSENDKKADLEANGAAKERSSALAAKSETVETKKLDVFNTMLLVAPPALLALIPMIAISEASGIATWFATQATPWHVFVLSSSCFIAFLLNLSTFWLLKVVSGVTYSVAGNFKVVVVIVVSVMIFRNPISLRSAIGCLVTIAGCFMYASVKQKTVVSDSAS